jgi:hypothetical protein
MADIDLEAVLASARDLARGGRWEQAARLVASTTSIDAHDVGELALAHAEIEVDWAFFTRREADPNLINRAHDLAADDAQRWAARFAAMRVDYARQLFVVLSGGAVDLPAVADLARRATDLTSNAVDRTGRAFANFYGGLIADVLAGDETAAEPYYRAGLDTDDEYFRSYALRHLGVLADSAGDHEAASRMWRESTSLRQRAGFVPGVLAQLVLLAEDMSGAQIVRDWADALGAGILVAAAAAIEPEMARELP